MSDQNHTAHALAEQLIATMPKTFTPDIEVTVLGIRPVEEMVEVNFRVAAKGLGFTDDDVEGQPVFNASMLIAPAMLDDVDRPAAAVVQELCATAAARDLLDLAEQPPEPIEVQLTYGGIKGVFYVPSNGPLGITYDDDRKGLRVDHVAGGEAREVCFASDAGGIISRP